ncbi:transposase [Kocuria rhizosphaericola]|uniref:transposase n=1 Tax=Kocuria rhizosphaericola TaxID=3376284 RepID=UPI003797D424
MVVETLPPVVGYPSCGVLTVGHGRCQVHSHALPCAAVPVRVVWRHRVHRCREDAFGTTTFCEVHELSALRERHTIRAIAWAVAQLRSHEIAVSALAKVLGVAWNTVWDAIAPVVEGQLAAEERLAGVGAFGVDEHAWSHMGPPGTALMTGIVDNSRDEAGRPQSRLLDLVPGRTGTVYADRLAAQGPAFPDGIRTAAPDPFHGYANAIRDGLPEEITVLDAFPVVKLAGWLSKRCAAGSSRRLRAIVATPVILSTASGEPGRWGRNT